MILRVVLVLFCAVALVPPAGAGEPAASLQGVVTWVYDGDTVEIETLGKVRLIGIDTPEREASARDAFLAKRGVPAARQRAASREARAFNISQVKGQQVSLVLGHPPRDRYGRLLAYVYLPDGRLLNRILLERGLAAVYRKYTFDMKNDFLAAEESAREAKIGLWQEADP